MVSGVGGRGAGRVTTKTGQDKTSTEAKRLRPTMVRAKEQMQRAGDQGCLPRDQPAWPASLYLSEWCLSGGGGLAWLGFPSFNTTLGQSTPHGAGRAHTRAGCNVGLEHSACYAKSGIPHVALQPLISEPGAIRERVCAWAMLPYLVICLVLGSVTKHKGKDRTYRLPTYHDRALSVHHPATRAPGEVRHGSTARSRHRTIHLAGWPRSNE